MDRSSSGSCEKNLGFIKIPQGRALREPYSIISYKSRESLWFYKGVMVTLMTCEACGQLNPSFTVITGSLSSVPPGP